MIYLDNSATTRQYDEVTDLMVRLQKDYFGNPSSLHSMGFEAGNYLFDAREEISRTFPYDGRIIFTSGGTESDNTAIFSVCRKMRRRGNKIITTEVEHPAVLECMKRLKEDGYQVEYLKADVNGYVEPQALKAALDENTILVTMMAVNNEVGTIEPVLPCYNIVQEFNQLYGTKILFHTDAVQAFGKMSFADAPFDLISISGHKFHGPKGVGALYVRKGVDIPPYILGGGQENGYRSGTENTPGIAGLGLAAKMTTENLFEKQMKMAKVNDYFRKAVVEEIPDVQLNGFEEQGMELTDFGTRCPSVINFSFLGTRGEVLLHTLEQDGIFVSTGSACASHHTGDSHVLQAMSMNHKEIESAIRFSFSEFNTLEEMDFVIDRLKAAVARFRRLGSFR
ncbi:MAG: cysteine desulfurase family protein [Eubacteriales bacterium]|nr:cysteine desulfurase family protein [Eubacteriales bacterium]